MSLNLDSLLPWLMEVRFIVGLTAAFSNVNFFSPQHELLFKHCLIAIYGENYGASYWKIPKVNPGENLFYIKNNPQNLFSMLCFPNLFCLYYLILFSHNSQSTERKKRSPMRDVTWYLTSHYISNVLTSTWYGHTDKFWIKGWSIYLIREILQSLEITVKRYMLRGSRGFRFEFSLYYLTSSLILIKHLKSDSQWPH